MLICGVEWCWICRLQHVVRTMQWALHHLRLANYVLWQSRTAEDPAATRLKGA